MEIIILICLLIIIVLLLQDKIISWKKSEKKPLAEKTNPILPDIMGRPKPEKSLSISNTTPKNQIREPVTISSESDTLHDENTVIQTPIRQENKAFENTLDLEQEEELLKGNGVPYHEEGFAQGVSFEELNSVGILLQKEKLEMAQKERAIAIVQKIQGTELFSHLENALPEASQRIAELLDSRLSPEKSINTIPFQKNNLENFDIGEFV
ncbi:conjugal transfer protein TraD [Elizabethkingia anophelis]|uniref:conjugal transfer protein TraD n=1 Tax=Elizabethkingia anophelis TaxID=1117645 RepID=UPI0013690296|nr:conjugal transfer protein TraD [Elizabethkingia anophelis]MYY43937.1 conjugal transfer protein TraD [Elizabethkingia anophelis]